MKKAKEEGPRSFEAFLREVADGTAHQELTEELFKLVRTTRGLAEIQNGASGKLTLDLSLDCNQKGVFTVKYDIKVKEPKVARDESHFWSTKGGNLTVENPKQQKLPLRDVSSPADARDVEEPAEMS